MAHRPGDNGYVPTSTPWVQLKEERCSGAECLHVVVRPVATLGHLRVLRWSESLKIISLELTKFNKTILQRARDSNGFILKSWLPPRWKRKAAHSAIA